MALAGRGASSASMRAIAAYSRSVAPARRAVTLAFKLSLGVTEKNPPSGWGFMIPWPLLGNPGRTRLTGEQAAAPAR